MSSFCATDVARKSVGSVACILFEDMEKMVPVLMSSHLTQYVRP